MSNINTSMDKSIQKSSTPDFLDCKPTVNEADRLTLVNETQNLLEDDLLKNHSELRQAQIHTAKALFNADDLETKNNAVKIRNCGRTLFKSASKTDHDPLWRAKLRCKQRSCASCSKIKGAQYTAMVAKALNQISFKLVDDIKDNQWHTPDHKKMFPLKLTLNGGVACSLEDIRPRITSLNTAWTKMLRTKLLKDNVVGALRSIEITETYDINSPDPKANPHLHGLILVRLCDIPLIIQHIRNYWYKATQKALANSGHPTPKKASACCVQEIKPLNRSTAKDVISWVQYATKGHKHTGKGHEARFFTTMAFHIAIDSAIKNLRLIATSGLLKEAIKLVKDEIKRAKLEAPTPTPFDLSLEQVTWSDRQGRYILAEDYNTQTDYDPFLLLNSLDRTKYQYDTWSTFLPKAQNEAEAIRQQDTVSKVLTKLIKNPHNFIVLEERAELLRINMKKSAVEPDPREPVEIDRHLFKDHNLAQKSLNSQIDTNGRTDPKTADNSDSETDQKTDNETA